jgi:hypothetical protein
MRVLCNPFGVRKKNLWTPHPGWRSADPGLAYSALSGLIMLILKILQEIENLKSLVSYLNAYGAQLPTSL